MPKVSKKSVEKKPTNKKNVYYMVTLEGYVPEGIVHDQSSSILIEADHFEVDESSYIALFYMEQKGLPKLVGAVRGWKRIMEISEDKFCEICKDFETQNKEAHKNLSSVFVEPGKI